MRNTALILGIVGGLIAGALGMKWLTDYGQLNELQRLAGGEQLRNLGTAGLLLIGSLVTGIAGGILAFRRKFLAGSVLMLAGAILPLLVARQTIIFLLPLLAGGIVAALAHTKRDAPSQRLA